MSLDHLEALAREATPGPWANGGDYVRGGLDGHPMLGQPLAKTALPADQSFIAAANPAAVLALVEEVRALRALRGGVEALLAHVEGQGEALAYGASNGAAAAAYEAVERRLRALLEVSGG